jgi:hypothetical protein
LVAAIMERISSVGDVVKIISSKEGKPIKISEIAERTRYKSKNGVGLSEIELDVISPYKVKSDIISQSIIDGDAMGESSINVEDMTIGYDEICFYFRYCFSKDNAFEIGRSNPIYINIGCRD